MEVLFFSNSGAGTRNPGTAPQILVHPDSHAPRLSLQLCIRYGGLAWPHPKTILVLKGRDLNTSNIPRWF